jgi:hypothetical protein
MPWEILIPIIVDLIKDCMAQGRREEDIRASLASPTGADWVVVWLALGRNKIRGRDRRDAIETLRAQVQMLTGDAVDGLLAEAREG